MKDETYIRKFAARFNLTVQEFIEPDFIQDKALKKGTVKSIGLTHKRLKTSLIDFNINDKGECVGYSTECRNSFYKLKNIGERSAILKVLVQLVQ